MKKKKELHPYNTFFSIAWDLNPSSKSFGVLRPAELRPFHASGSNRGYGAHLLIVWNKS